MASTHSYSFLSDYSPMASCLFAIKEQEANGLFASHPAIIRRLKVFEGDVLKKLYHITLGILGRIEGDIVITTDYLTGDFAQEDFSGYDFYIGFQHSSGTGYSSVFQTVLNIFGEFTLRSSELTDVEKQQLEVVLIPVLEAFEELQEELQNLGLNPCNNIVQDPYFNNSKEIYIQAAGSLGAAGIPEGIHLRFSLTGDLGDNHLPQGTYANTISGTTGFNKANDFISIYRTPYAGAVRITLDFEEDKPAVNYQLKRWTYYLNSTVNGEVYTNKIRLSFKDNASYDALATTINPLLNSFDFLKEYDGLLEIELYAKAAYLISFDYRKKIGSSSSSILKLDAYADPAAQNQDDDEIPSIRRTIQVNTDSPVSEELFGENIRRIQLKKSSDGYIQSFSFETYHDFISVKDETDWTLIGNSFSLSLNDTEVYNRLEDPAHPIDNLWPQYNEGTKVKVANYQEKWSVDRVNDPSLKNTVQQYLSLSQTNPRAEGIIKLDGIADAEELLISYLDVINIMALDYHIARMLGLGHIDYLESVASASQFIYKISYNNRKNIASAEYKDHEYLSLPTSKSNTRLPLKPVARSLNYGLALNDELSETAFNSEGYAAYADIRAVNVGRMPFNYELAGSSFFNEMAVADNFNISENTSSVLYSIEYRPAGQSNYLKPEITTEKLVEGNAADNTHTYYAYDDEYPVTGVPETVPVPDNINSLYIHFEKQEGIHYYAIYGISWFSRASLLSEEVATDATVFPVKNNLQPPTDLAVQYIQEEDSLLFTTQLEQNWLSGRTQTFENEDINFTRLSFNFLDITDISYVQDIQNIDVAAICKANEVRAYFKEELPLELRGQIVNTTDVEEEESYLWIHTAGYSLIDGTPINPFIQAADYVRFYNSILNTPGGKFRIIEIVGNASSMILKVEKILEVETVEDPLEPGTYASVETYRSPEIGSRFTMVENLSTATNWDTIQKNISLIDFSNPATPVIETETDDEGNEFHYLAGGIHGEAIVNKLLDPLNVVVEGYYTLTFNNVNLADHPQANIPFDPASPQANSPGSLRDPHVEWYKGLIRINYTDGDKKLLEVVRIVQTNPLILYVLDPGYRDQEMPLSSSGTDYISGINYHPGYKVYLFPEPSPGEFNGSNILPSGSVSEKKTLIGLQSVDNRANGTGFSSGVSVPAILLSRKIQKPVQLEAPIAFSLKVRPDATSKAAFTFDTKIAPDGLGQARQPFGFNFYRTTNEDLLYALYDPETVIAIQNSLSLLTNDAYYSLRFLDLANQVFDEVNTDAYKVYPAEPLAYGFPFPDKENLVTPEDSGLVKKEKYKNAIRSTLLPLTEQTPVYSYIKEGHQTENKLPAIRDIDGNLLETGDIGFDPFPMIRKYQKAGEANTSYVRFTDYNLHASSRYLYFYTSAEVTNQLLTGPLSPFTGPVLILHTVAGPAPVIQSYTITTSFANAESPIAVQFSVSPFAFAEDILKIRIYRTLNQSQAISLSSYLDVIVSNNGLDSINITDTFNDLVTVPIGETLYYRLAGIRKIMNENEEQEEVLSIGSEVITIKLIDTLNPEAPELTYLESSNKLTFIPSTNKATYYLYKQNSRGNWEKLETINPEPEANLIEYELPVLAEVDEDGDPLYHRFKVKVENSSGLLNLQDKELTI